MSLTSEDILRSIDTVIIKRITNLSYDNTKVCTIKDAARATEGIYTVYDGSSRFEAYGNKESYSIGQSVRVQIVNNDMTDIKYIIGPAAASNINSKLKPSLENQFIDISGNILTTTNETHNIQKHKTLFDITQEEILAKIPDINFLDSFIFSGLFTNMQQDEFALDFEFTLLDINNKEIKQTETFTSSQMIGDYKNYYLPTKNSIIFSIEPQYRIKGLTIKCNFESSAIGGVAPRVSNCYLAFGLNDDEIKIIERNLLQRQW